MKTRNHKTLKLTVTTAALGLAMLLARESRALTITDNFTDPTKWGTPYAVPGKNISIGNGRMNYTSTTTAGGGAGIPRNEPILATTQDWSLKVDVHVDPFTLTSQDQYTDVFLGFGKTGDWFNTHVIFEFDRGWWQSPNDYDIDDDVRINGVDAPGLFNVSGLTSPDAALRLDYNAATHTITYLFDADGATGGYNWAAQGSADLASGTYNLNMSATDTFTIFLLGSSEFTTVVAGQAYLSNLEITVVTPALTRPVLGISWSNDLPKLSITGDLGSKYAVECLTSLAASNNWQSLVTNTLTTNPQTFTDTTATGAPRRFYRARLVP